MTNKSSLRHSGVLEARVPRYTSYPTANHFGVDVNQSHTREWLAALPEGAELSLYVHVPFCRRLCNFCACRTQGTQTDRPLYPYIATVLQELAFVGAHAPQSARIRRLHLGGGTPTLLPAALLLELGESVRALREITTGFELSAEIDPTEFSPEIADVLLELGLTRASIGVQDFDPLVQEAIGRKQSFKVTSEAVHLLRQRGVESINMDLLYGLPHQTPTRLISTLEKIIALSPERIALYGYAHVPWVAKRQQLIREEDLPSPEERVALFELARQILIGAGYLPIGIDHFARPCDGLAIAAMEGKLKRNFQGYTDDNCTALIGLGASAISKFPQGYAQNASATAAYVSAIEAGHFATARGHRLSAEDRLRADLIEDVMCNFQVHIARHAQAHGCTFDDITRILLPMIAEYGQYLVHNDDVIEIVGPAAYIARLLAYEIDTYAMPEGRHSRAV